MASSNQGGSILSFLLIGGVLTVLLVGGAYAVQQRAKQSVTPPVVTQPSSAPAAEDKKVAVEPGKEAPKQETKKEEPKKAEPQKEAEKKESPKPTAPAQVTPPVSTELPRTGLADNLSAILGLGLLSYAGVAYVRSRSRAATL